MRTFDTADDVHWMRVALRFAQRAKGITMPNPAVGCVIVKNNHLIAAAHTALAGRPHAETQALQHVGLHAQGATLYVTLEPCAHTGQTPPCAQAIINAGIARVVIACEDPYPQVNGQGTTMLRAAGISVTTGVLHDEAHAHHLPFFTRITKKHPLVSLKIATSLDGHIATATGESKWITGTKAREHAHSLRAQHEAILTGIGTVLADDPLLTCRLAGYTTASPLRIILDAQLRIPLTSKIVATAKEIPTWIIASHEATHPTAQALTNHGVRIISHNTRDIAALLAYFASEGISSVLVEAGSTLSTSFMQTGHVDRLYWYRAPLVIGAGGIPAFTMNALQSLAHIPHWHCEQRIPLHKDLLEVYSLKKGIS